MMHWNWSGRVALELVRKGGLALGRTGQERLVRESPANASCVTLDKSGLKYSHCTRVVIFSFEDITMIMMITSFRVATDTLLWTEVTFALDSKALSLDIRRLISDVTVML